MMYVKILQRFDWLINKLYFQREVITNYASNSFVKTGSECTEAHKWWGLPLIGLVIADWRNIIFEFMKCI